MAERYTVFSSAMFISRESTYTNAVLVIIIVLSLLNNPVIGKSLILRFLEEEWPDFQSTYRDGTHLMEEYDIFNS